MRRFRPTWQGRDIFAVRVPQSKARYSQVFEALEAARWRGISDAAYDALDVQDKARLIAHYRVSTRLAAIEAWEQVREIKRGR